MRAHHFISSADLDLDIDVPQEYVLAPKEKDLPWLWTAYKDVCANKGAASKQAGEKLKKFTVALDDFLASVVDDESREANYAKWSDLKEQCEAAIARNEAGTIVIA